MSWWLSGLILSSVQRSPAVQDRAPANHSLWLCLPSDKMKTTKPDAISMTVIHFWTQNKLLLFFCDNCMLYKYFSVFMFSCSFFSIIFLVILMTKQILYYNVYHKRFHQNGVLYAYVWSKNTSALCLQCKTTDVQTDNSLIDRLRERQILTCFLWLRV